MLVNSLWRIVLSYFSVTDYIDIQTPYGEVRGYHETSRDFRSYWSFKGVPYAQPPVGRLRFEPPQSIGRWEHIDARKLPPLCTQYDHLFKRFSGQEDCLYLNVFTPKLPKLTTERVDGLLPVILFVHGGAFLYGGSDIFGPDYFMDEDVIVVTVHYRLGVLGFLNTADDTIRGNMGAKDVLEALKWVHKGISSFGGDPARITVTGHSSGAALVHYLILSGQTKGLINNAIVLSGTALAPWAFVKNTRKQAFRVGNALGCSSKNDSQRLLKCLQSLDALTFSNFHRIEGEFWSEKFGPSIEYPESEEAQRTAFLTRSPSEISKSANYHRIPWVLGVVAAEGFLLSASIIDRIEKINQDWNELSGILDIYKDPAGMESVRQEYFGNQLHFSERDLHTFTQLMSDRDFNSGVEEAATNYINLTNFMKLNSTNPEEKEAPLYLYYFNYTGRIDMTELGVGHLVTSKYKNKKWPIALSLVIEVVKIRLKDWFGMDATDYGVCHGDDIKYMFQPNQFLPISSDSPNYKFSKEFVQMWVKFARTSKPAENWSPADSNNSIGSQLSFYQISGPPPSSSYMILDPMDSRRMQFWKQFPTRPLYKS